MASGYLQHLVKKGQPFLYRAGLVSLITPAAGRNDVSITTGQGSHAYALEPGPTINMIVQEAAHSEVPNRTEVKQNVLDCTLYEIVPRLLLALGDAHVDLEQVQDRHYLDGLYQKDKRDQPRPDMAAVVSEAVGRLQKQSWLFFEGQFYEVENVAFTPARIMIGDDDHSLTRVVNPLVHMFSNIRKEMKKIQQCSRNEEAHRFDHFYVRTSGKDVKIALKIAPYVLRDFFNDQYSRYGDGGPAYRKLGATEVGVKLSVLGQVPQAKYFRGSGPFRVCDAGLCMGHYSTGYYQLMPYPDAVVKHLLDMKKVVLTGYQRGANPSRYLCECGKRVSARDIEEGKVKATNEWGA